MWNSVVVYTSILEIYSEILIRSSTVCEECGSPGPYVTTGILNAFPKMFMSPVPVFLIRIGRFLHTSIIERDSARTNGEV